MSDVVRPNNHISTIMKEYVKELEFKYQNSEELCGISTCYDCLDYKLDGLKSGEVTIIGGRPAMGKTALAANLSYNIAAGFYFKHQQNPADDKCVVYIGLELAPKLFANRLLSLQTAIPTYKLRYAEDLEKNFDKICKAERAFRELPIYYLADIFEVDGIEKELQKIEKQVGCVIIDYLQLLGEEYPAKEDYSLIVLQLKSLAVKLGIPIVVLSQLKRDLESRADKHPLISDIHGYARNQNAADNILFLYRENYYIKFAKPTKHKKETEEHYQKRVRQWQKRCDETENICEIIIARNSGGFCGIIKLHFDWTTGLFWEEKRE